ncbi:hypothetical protein PAHAL_2G268900 [Panicum hallii]|uniref:AUGMIN subunit 8 n=1 Tax=Panicum hallii TaxID=206008 RepID=A0A2S3GZM6_9POAL|nr:AUGMIN subunit 8-like isoform X1 [Panicum hallii]PAN12498.1 hypothetical protein PAHAL_2G268900 [Panicum hallii]
MDALKSDVKKATLVDETLRPPLVPSEKHNAFRGRDVASRYKTGLADATKTRRCTSPSLGHTSATEGTPAPKRAQSADRRRPSTPSSRVSTPSMPTPRSITPVRDTARDLHKSSKRIASTKAPDGLWPAMRNLSSSFQSESVAAPATKKDKVISASLLDCTKGEVSVLTERKRSPFRRKNIIEQCENAQPSEEPSKRVIEQHRWPAMIGGQVPKNLMSRSIDLADKATRRVPSANTSRGLSPRKTPSVESSVKGLNPSLDEVARSLAIQASRSDDKVDSQKTERSKSVSRPNRTVTFPVPILQRASSPNKALSAASSSSRAFQSPSRTRPSTPCRSQSAGAIQASVTSPLINYMVDARKGKKNASQIENIHQLRLLYNRHLQWRFINAYAEDTLSFQKATVENIIYNVWRNTINLRDSVNMRRIMMQHLQQELRLYRILKEQIVYLEQWPTLERDNSISLFGATEALKASTLRLPVTSGAKVDAIALKNAVSSAVDVMQGLGSSVCCMLSKVTDRESLVSELSVIAGQEKVMLDECRELLATAAKLQVQESSLRTHLMQQRHRLHDMN